MEPGKGESPGSVAVLNKHFGCRMNSPMIDSAPHYPLTAVGNRMARGVVQGMFDRAG